MLIDWHSHHTPAEIADEIGQATGKSPHIDRYDTPDFSKRVKEMDAVKLDVQLVCQGAGLYADQFPSDQAMALVRKSNDVIAERVSAFRDRLFGVSAVSLKNIEGSVGEVKRMAQRGFRAVLLYPRANGDFVLDSPAAEPLLAEISGRGLPIFLHGVASPNDPSLKRLEDEGVGVLYSVVADAQVSECVARMIAGGVFDRHSGLKIVIRTGGGGLPLLLHRFFWKHKGPKGEQRYSEIFLEHFLIDTAGVDARTLRFLIGTLGPERIVFGSDYCGGLGPLEKALPVLEDQPDAARVKASIERNSRRLLGL